MLSSQNAATLFKPHLIKLLRKHITIWIEITGLIDNLSQINSNITNVPRLPSELSNHRIPAIVIRPFTDIL